MDNTEIRQLICPMCETGMEHKKEGNTHIYICEACPFLGLEYMNVDNLKDLTEYINRI